MYEIASNAKIEITKEIKMIIDTMENYESYFTTDGWKQIFVYLKTLTADTPEGKYPLSGDDIIVNVDEYETKGIDDCVLETHEEYVDIQLLLAGEEFIDIYPADGLTVKNAYDPARDVAFYHVPDATPVRVKLVPGNFTVLFPQDAHSPQIRVSDSQGVKKVVVKVTSKMLLNGN